ncbi:MAG: hypothetical protein B6I38_10775 [Anaerolineaceae bacterium 4572_5.1]|nr:MAG: hypothetical protein B6I38_10775 [Anaerolineaceae bacterium 4572_5.1]RLD02950.1 MAG: hypothetical protein DRI56_13305 [Chloroflexota bacterium]
MSNQTSRVGKEHILEIAEQLFTEQGYQAVSVRTIAEACGVTNAALYYYFASKEALFLEVIKQYAARLGARMRKMGERDGSFQERVTAMAQEYMKLMSNRRSLPYLLRHNGKSLNKEKVQGHFVEISTTVLSPIEEILQEAIEAGELRMIPEDYFGASIFLSMLHGVDRFRKMNCQESLTEKDVQLVVDLFWNGMKKTSSASNII